MCGGGVNGKVKEGGSDGEMMRVEREKKEKKKKKKESCRSPFKGEGGVEKSPKENDGGWYAKSEGGSVSVMLGVKLRADADTGEKTTHNGQQTTTNA